MKKLVSTYTTCLPLALLQGQGQDMPCTADYSLSIFKEEDFE